jgi:hypothetical protein
VQRPATRAINQGNQGLLLKQGLNVMSCTP